MMMVWAQWIDFGVQFCVCMFGQTIGSINTKRLVPYLVTVAKRQKTDTRPTFAISEHDVGCFVKRNDLCGHHH